MLVLGSQEYHEAPAGSSVEKPTFCQREKRVGRSPGLPNNSSDPGDCY